MRNIFKYQILQFLIAITLLILIKLFVVDLIGVSNGKLLGIKTSFWFWIAICTPIIHQFYVAFVWRFELYKNVFTSYFGIKKAFKFYSIGFSVLFVARLISIIFLAVSNKNTLQINPIFVYILVALIVPLVVYLFYSVKKYFTVERAYGIDHFDKNYNVAYVKKGIFKYTNNGMYVFGLMILYLPGLLLFSKAAIIAAIFNHIFIWAHYYFTELPDMKEIYGKTPK